MLKTVFAPGARVVIRDAEWLVRKVDVTSTGGQALSVVGLSELVKDKEAIFLTEIDKSIQVMDPADTELVPDGSNYYRDSLLYMESLLRQTPPTDENLYIGHQAAMDVVPYQLDPAIQALKQPRRRILIADAVGLGKTIEVGVLLTELIKRGRGKRILVLTVKSMLTQFQKELWSRFTIPLTRLDSIGIQRIRSRIPTYQNPFFYFDRSIISIDTLKQDIEYRTYLENCYWDIIVIDEAHNVAERGTNSLRSRLARLLSSRSDTLIMLSATPHDGKPGAFASLMNMLNPIAIPDPENYGPEDIKGLFVRRFKKDIKDQVKQSFKERRIIKIKCQATPLDEEVFDTLADLNFTKIDQRRTAGKLFKTTLEKALFSSPAACLQTVNHRINRLKNENDPSFDVDIASLENLADVLKKIGPSDFSKYQNLLKLIRDKKNGPGWNGKDPEDRLVVFSERIETLKFLEENLKRDLKLKDNRISILHGGLSDVEQEEIVEDFGKEEAPIRLLLASDVASEGINLHFLSHKMIHFDIPWSLMVFQQRNGRIDRYGQEKEPTIFYLMTESQNEKIRGDTRILALLIDKDDQAMKNIGDPSALMGVYDIELEENITARAIEDNLTTKAFESGLQAAAVDPLAILWGEEEVPTGQAADDAKQLMASLFPDDFAFLKEAVEYVRRDRPVQAEFDDKQKTATITAPSELENRFKFLPKEIWPENGRFVLSADRKEIMKEIKRSRKEELVWPKIHLLWEQHPVMNWVNDKVTAAFGRNQAPVLVLNGGLQSDESIFIMSGLVPNRKGHPLVHRWFGVQFVNDTFLSIISLEDVLKRTEIHRKQYPNKGGEVDASSLKKLVPLAVAKAYEWMKERRDEFEACINEKLNAQYREIERLKDRKYHQLEFRFSQNGPETRIVRDRKEKERREIDKIFKEFLDWIEETMTTEKAPYIRVVSVLKGGR
ncbi:MAG: DEAD/DEAH box helicase [Syntrophobacteraceae bacterium]